MSSTPSPRQAGAGRPRDTSIDERVLSVARDLLAEHGLDGVTIEAVARAAGVGKASLYRRWRDRIELALAAVWADPADLPARAGLPGFLRAAVDNAASDLERPDFRAVLPGFVSHALDDPRWIEDRRIGPEVKMLAATVERARARGEVLPGADADLLFELYGGALLVRTLRGLPTPPAYRRKLVSFLLAGSRIENPESES